MSDPRPMPLTDPGIATPAQARVAGEVLGWGGTRPVVPAGLLEDLAAHVRSHDPVGATTAAQRGPGRVVALGTLLGLASGHRPPGRHGYDTVRGLLLGDAFARDVEGRHVGPAAVVVEAAARALAAERPADPSSASAWLNALPTGPRRALLEEVTAVLEDLRGLWPVLPTTGLTVQLRPTLRAGVGPGPVQLAARPDLLLDSPRRDDHARALVLVFRAGMPRPPYDRDRARATAVVTALATGRVPFRWGVLHLTDGRAEVEDLDPAVLLDTAGRLGALLRQHAEGITT